MTELRQVETRAERDGRTISGIAAPFDKLSLDLGGFVERISPGAFSDSLRTHPDVVLLHSHDASQPLARTLSGTLELHESREGLEFRATLPSSATGRHMAELIDRGDLRNMSISFMVQRAADEEWTGDRAGNVVRTLKRVRLLEVSTVTWPAYPQTFVEARNAQAARGRLVAAMQAQLRQREAALRRVRR